MQDPQGFEALETSPQTTHPQRASGKFVVKERDDSVVALDGDGLDAIRRSQRSSTHVHARAPDTRKAEKT